MYAIVATIRRNFLVFSALLLTVITKFKVAANQCNPEEIMRCSKPLSMLDSGLTFVSTKADLDRICPDLKHAIRCIHQYTRICMSLNEKRNFKSLFHGTAEMVNNLCRNGTYQEEYLRHAPCMQTVDPHNQICLKRYSDNMSDIQSKTPTDNISQQDLLAYRSMQKKKRDAANEGIKNVCCAFQEYVDCSTSTTRRVCGQEAGDFSKKFLDKMSSSMIQLHCQNYGPRECGLIPSSSASSFIKMVSQTSAVALSLLVVLL